MPADAGGVEFVFRNIHTKRTPLGNILFVHGYRAHGLMHAGFLRGLYREGFNVFSFDLPNHGKEHIESPRRGCVDAVLYIEAVRAAIARVAERSRIPVFIIGESLGGATLINALADGQKFEAVRGIVCIAVPLSVDARIPAVVKPFKSVILKFPPLQKMLGNIIVDSAAFPCVRRAGNDGMFEYDPLYFLGPTRLASGMHIRRIVEGARENIREFKHANMLWFWGTHDDIAPRTMLEHVVANEGMPPRWRQVTLHTDHFLLYGADKEIRKTVLAWALENIFAET